VKQAARDPVVDAAVADLQLEQLRARDDAVLPSRQLGADRKFVLLPLREQIALSTATTPIVAARALRG
jgi:hypothetical protein